MTDPNAGAVPPPSSQQPAQNIPNYLVQSILVTLFCCLPFGVAAIVFASQVNSKLQMGDVEGALDASKKAKTFCWVALGLGIAGSLLYFGLVALGFMGAVAESATGY